MATIAVGDIHGNLAALADLLNQVAPEVSDQDTVAFLGDYIDRGPDSKGCIDAILEFRRAVGARVVCLCGNHEDWFLRTQRDYRRHSWLLGMEAFDTIRSYSPDAGRALRNAVAATKDPLYMGSVELPYDLFFRSVPDEHLRFFETLLPHYRTPDCICVHAGLDPQEPRLESQPRQVLIWGADGFPEKYAGPDIVVYGHSDDAGLDEDGWPHPKIIGQTIGLDTISHGVLTAMRLPDRRVFQSARHQA